MVEFRKSTKYQRHYAISAGDTTIWVRVDHIKGLKSALERGRASDGDVKVSYAGGYVGDYMANGHKVSIAPSVEPQGFGRTSQSVVYMTANERSELLAKIEQEALRQVVINEGLEGLT